MTMTDGNYRRQSSHRSRDLSTSSATMVRERQRVVSSQQEGATATTRGHVAPPRPQRTPVAPKRRFQRAPGSQQVFSWRGRRVERPKVDPALLKAVISFTLLIVSGVLLAMMLSGLSTTQTFKLQELRNQETTLSNQLETLHRDLQQVSASAEIARHAEELGMVVPDQPGVLITDAEGNIVEQRPATGDTRPMMDINGGEVRPSTKASSDPEETDAVADSLNAVPNTFDGNQTRLAPYATTSN